MAINTSTIGVDHEDGSWIFDDHRTIENSTKGNETMTDQTIQELLINAVKTSTADVFSTMLGIEAEVGEVFVSQGSPRPTEGVVSLIGLAGPWMGTGSISCNPKMACRIAGALMMGEYAAVDEEVLDAVAEVTNMVIGNVKTVLEERVGPMGLSIPTVIFGRNFSTKSAGSSNWTIVPFSCGEDRILVQVCLVQNSEGSTPSRIGFTNPHMAAVR